MKIFGLKIFYCKSYIASLLSFIVVPRRSMTITSIFYAAAPFLWASALRKIGEGLPAKNYLHSFLPKEKKLPL